MEISEDRLVTLCRIYENLGTFLTSYQNSLKHNSESSPTLQKISKENLKEAYTKFRENFSEKVVREYTYINTIERYLKTK